MLSQNTTTQVHIEDFVIQHFRIWQWVALCFPKFGNLHDVSIVSNGVGFIFYDYIKGFILHTHIPVITSNKMCSWWWYINIMINFFDIINKASLCLIWAQLHRHFTWRWRQSRVRKIALNKNRMMDNVQKISHFNNIQYWKKYKMVTVDRKREYSWHVHLPAELVLSVTSTCCTIMILFYREILDVLYSLNVF
jgi:hypothetical protein